MKYHAIFVLKLRQNLKFSSAAIVGGALRVDYVLCVND